jgi:hypothetical protein
MAIVTHLVVLATMANHVLATKAESKLNVTETIVLSPPNAPNPGRQVVDAAYSSYSVEFSYMADFGGNNTYATTQGYPSGTMAGWINQC